MTINKPLGGFEWVAVLDDNSIVREFDGDTQRSSDCWKDLPLKEVHLLPVTDGLTYTVIRCGPDESVTKKWIRTFTLGLDSGESDEHPVIDAFTLQSARPVHHYVFWNGEMMVQVITTDAEP